MTWVIVLWIWPAPTAMWELHNCSGSTMPLSACRRKHWRPTKNWTTCAETMPNSNPTSGMCLKSMMMTWLSLSLSPLFFYEYIVYMPEKGARENLEALLCYYVLTWTFLLFHFYDPIIFHVFFFFLGGGPSFSHSFLLLQGRAGDWQALRQRTR